MKILDDKAIAFFETYLNNAAPTGYEAAGPKTLDGLPQTPMWIPLSPMYMELP